MAYVIERDSRSGKRDTSIADALEEIFDGPHPAVGGHAPCQVTSSVLSKTHIPTNMVGEPVGKVAVAGRTEPGDNGGHAKNHHDHRPTNARICRIEGVAPGRIYAQECIIFHDSASVLTSQRQLLRNLFT